MAKKPYLTSEFHRDLVSLNQRALSLRQSGDVMAANDLQQQAAKLRAQNPKKAALLADVAGDPVLESLGMAEPYRASSSAYYNAQVARGIQDKSIRQLGPSVTELLRIKNPDDAEKMVRGLDDVDLGSMYAQVENRRLEVDRQQLAKYGGGPKATIQTLLARADAHQERNGAQDKLFSRYPDLMGGSQGVNELAVLQRARELNYTASDDLTATVPLTLKDKDGKPYQPDVLTLRENIRNNDPETMQALVKVCSDPADSATQREAFRKGPLYTEYLAKWKPDISEPQSDKYSPEGIKAKSILSDKNIEVLKDDLASPSPAKRKAAEVALSLANPVLGGIAVVANAVENATGQTEQRSQLYWFEQAKLRGEAISALPPGTKASKEDLDAYKHAYTQFETLTAGDAENQMRNRKLRSIELPWVFKPAAQDVNNGAGISKTANTGLNQ